METITDYDLGISYTPGKANVMADALSHKSYCDNLMVKQAQPRLFEELRKLNLCIVPQGSLNNLVIQPDLEKAVKNAQAKDAEIDLMKKDLHLEKYMDFSLSDDGTLYFRNRIVVPRFELMTDKVMKEAHDTPLSIHPGNTKMYRDLRQRYWWSRMKQDIARYVVECDVCRRVKAKHQKPAGILQALPIPLWKWDKVQMDLISALSATVSKSADGSVHISLVNVHPSKSISVSSVLKNLKVKTVTGRILTSGDIHDHNTFDQPNKVTTKEFKHFKLKGDQLTVEMPARSVVSLELK
jgi:hypothetical protein